MYSLLHVTPSPEYPSLQEQVKEPSVSLQFASGWQLCKLFVHSSISVKTREILKVKFCGLGAFSIRSSQKRYGEVHRQFFKYLKYKLNYLHQKCVSRHSVFALEFLCGLEIFT